MLISELVKKYKYTGVMFRDVEIQLKDCPFCGGEAELRFAERLSPPCHYTVAAVHCTNCRAQMSERTVDGFYGDESTVNDVIDDWNNRPLQNNSK